MAYLGPPTEPPLLAPRGYGYSPASPSLQSSLLAVVKGAGRRLPRDRGQAGRPTCHMECTRLLNLVTRLPWAKIFYFNLLRGRFALLPLPVSFSLCAPGQIYNPVYTGPLIRIGIRIKANPDTCKRANPAWKPDCVIHIRMWFRTGLNAV